MLSQVERGETSPTLAIAGADRRRPRADALAAAAPRRGRHRRRSCAAGERRRAAAARAATPTRCSPRRCPGQRAELSRAHARARRRDRRRRRPADARARQPRDGAGRAGARRPDLRRRAPRARRRRHRDLRRRPARTTSRTPARARRPSSPSSPPACDAADRQELRCPRRCSTRSGTPTRSRPACSTSTCTSSTRSRAPQAFDGLRLAGRRVRRPDRTLATADHNVPTDGTPRRRAHQATSSRACRSRRSSATARSSASRSTRIGSERQGIVHVIGPELGVTQPGMTIVCGDSHTATHGAFGALAFGIGTSEVEHVLATQTLAQRKPRSMRIRYEGELGFGVTRQGPDPRHDRPDGRRRRASATSSSTPARRSRRSRWRAA